MLIDQNKGGRNCQQCPASYFFFPVKIICPKYEKLRRTLPLDHQPRKNGRSRSKVSQIQIKSDQRTTTICRIDIDKKKKNWAKKKSSSPLVLQKGTKREKIVLIFSSILIEGKKMHERYY